MNAAILVCVLAAVAAAFTFVAVFALVLALWNLLVTEIRIRPVVASALMALGLGALAGGWVACLILLFQGI